MADETEEKHAKSQRERNDAISALRIAKELDQKKMKNGARFVPGPLRSMILKINK